MNQTVSINLVKSGVANGSYRRGTYKTDTIYTFYQYKEVLAEFNIGEGSVHCTDTLSEQIFLDGLITLEQKRAYEKRLQAYFLPVDAHDEASVEQIDREICLLRKECLGTAVLEKEFALRANRGIAFDPTGGIDQRHKKEEMLRSCETLIFILCQPELSWMMEQDMQAAQSKGKEVYLFPYCGNSVDLMDLPGDAHLQSRIQAHRAGMFFYGEEGLLHCKNLVVDAIVHGVPTGYYTRAVTNQFGVEQACVVYVPAELDITKYVPLTKRTKVSYYHLARLWDTYGDGIYTHTVEELYQKYPQFFLNIYQCSNPCPEVEQDYPIHIYDCPGYESFEYWKDQAIKSFFSELDGVTYCSTYFDEQMEAIEVPWENVKNNGILVHAVKVNRVNSSGIVNCEQYATLREMVKTQAQKQRHLKKANKLQIYSNFLFFLTPLLSRLYNDLRAERPREQIPWERMHLDYKLCLENGKRVETFPLFRKACIAMKDDGKFLFFNYRLGGGRINVGDYSIAWSQNDIDIEELADTTNGRICDSVRVYTPYYSLCHVCEDIKNFRILVGEDRVNLVLVQDHLICVRKGAVILPSVGVVVSLDEKTAEAFLRHHAMKPLEDGYFDCKQLEITVELDAPAGIPATEWKRVLWAYGGGMSLILDGEGLCDEQETGTGTAMLERLHDEGWMSPLSCQTQESALHKMEKHPRTAIGTTEDGSLIILVYSGRTHMSAGADYNDMIKIARKLFPSIRNLMNVDGGGSSVLGMSMDGSFMELSYPATSITNCAGMVRPVNTVLCLEI